MHWDTAVVPGARPDGNPVIAVLSKRTYVIGPGTVTVADKQVPLCTEDTFEEPDAQFYSEVTAETDLVPYKPTTDVVVLGSACAPRGRLAFHLDCEAHVGLLHKTVRVFGHRKVEVRHLRGAAISDSEPFCEIPLGYTRAYGGTAKSRDGTIYPYYPNPIGRGFAIRGGTCDLSSLVLPNLEDPELPLTPDNLLMVSYDEWPSAPRPCSLGWTRRNFYPRYTYLGVLPEFLQAAGKARKSLADRYPGLGSSQLPRMDYRAYQGASDGLWGRQLQGNEPVKLTYLDPDNPVLEFKLPGDIPEITLDIGDGPVGLDPALQTLVINVRGKLMTMLWRGMMKFGGVRQLGELSVLRHTVR